jgi:exopolysaccharide biosynthesis protein
MDIVIIILHILIDSQPWTRQLSTFQNAKKQNKQKKQALEKGIKIFLDDHSSSLTSRLG